MSTGKNLAHEHHPWHPSRDPVQQDPRLDWLYKDQDNIRPYVFVRPENRIHHPGHLHHHVTWFPHEVIYKNPLEMKEVKFADRILTMEAKAFGPSNMVMPRWVFYDCAILPGFVAGFAARTKTLSKEVRDALDAHDDSHEWTPLSLFIIIPTMSEHGEWVAHNLCSVNSLVDKDAQFYGIGYFSKAFGLWYANVRSQCGMTQWTSPAIKLHSHYGEFEILTAFTPVHSYAHTVTYRLNVDPLRWPHFFTKEQHHDFHERFEPAGFEVAPTVESSLIAFQDRLQRSEGPFFLDSLEIRTKTLDEPLQVYRRKTI